MKYSKGQFGFTVIELLVTMGIFMLLAGVVLAKYRTFSTSSDFANAGESIVLALRQAQVYGAGSKGGGGVITCGGSAFNCAYGVHAELGQSNISIFIDENNDKIYDTGEKIVEIIQWGSSVSINTLSCGVAGLSCTGDVMDITFNRPNPNAYITDSSRTPYDRGVIEIKDSKVPASPKTVTISSAGQISI